jgi:hypothetical protein
MRICRLKHVSDQTSRSAGVPAYKMQVGAFGDPKLRRYGRVAVLVSA